MKRRLLTIILVLLIALSLPIQVLAQDYYFSLDALTVDVYWNSDGTSSLHYYLTFTNQPNGHSIDFVDVGIPNGSFDVDSIKADIDGRPLSISLDFQGEGNSGFAVEMGSHAIPPGSTGTVHVYVGRVSDVLYNDDKYSNYTSAVFAPLYFLSNVITGSTAAGARDELGRAHVDLVDLGTLLAVHLDADEALVSWRAISGFEKLSRSITWHQ